MKYSPSFLGFCVLFLIATALGAAPAPSWAKSAINKNWRGLALKGYDTVAYFTLGKPVKGKKEFEYKWHDAKWRFANQAHRDLFASNPAKYAPQYGGY